MSEAQNYDDNFKRMVYKVDEIINKGDDDFLTFCTGPRGTGKSNIMLWAMELYLGDKASLDYIGYDFKTHARALKATKDSGNPKKFCGNDEANISKRDSLSKKNKDMIDMYFKIRGVNIWHWWNNPSADYIDKTIIEDLIRGLILITSKEKNRPRTYYYFNKERLLQVYEKYGNIKNKTLKSVCGKYALWKGWFKEYNGILKSDYLKMKSNRMSNAIDEYADKFGGDVSEDEQEDTYSKFTMTSNEVKALFNRNPRENIYNFIMALEKKNLVQKGRDYLKYNLGKTSRLKFNKEAMVKIRDQLIE